MSGVSRFDCYPSDFLNGVVGLSGDEIAAYTIIMMLQYDRGGPVAYAGREREIAVRSGLPKGRLTKAIEGLIGIGKLTLADDGCLFNKRTGEELEKIAKRFEENAKNSQMGGKANKARLDRIHNEINENESRADSQPDSRNIALLPSSLPPPPIKQDYEATASSSTTDAVDGGEPAEIIKLETPSRKASSETLRLAGEGWNDLAATLRLAAIESIKPGSSRERAVLARVREFDESPAEGLTQLYAKIRGSPYLRGEVNGFRATFDWVFKAANYQKIMEGNYEVREQKNIHQFGSFRR